MARSILEGSEVLVVEDEQLLRRRLGAFLERLGASVTAVGTVSHAQNALETMPFDYVLLDINLPDGNGLDLLKNGLMPATTSVVVMTAEGGVQIAVEAMRVGAADYLTKPFDPEELPLVFQRALKARQSERMIEHSSRSTNRGWSLFLGAGMKDVEEQLSRILAADKRLREGLPPILIEGETGSGKTSIARWLHREGSRGTKPLVEVNCAALPETLAESELFGHERGAFTDAKSSRIGLFEAADGGTLFLDEVAALSPATQTKLLVAIEDRKIRRVGGRREISVDVQLIAASNRDLRQMVQDGEFREDLYHRLDLLRVRIPPLRARSNEIPALADHLLENLCQKYRLTGVKISPQGKARLQRYAWPGNVRELAHELERALVLSMGEEDLDLAHLEGGPPSEAFEPGESTGLPTDDWLNPGFRFPEVGGFDLEEAINRLIRKALDQTGGNVSGAARLLGVNRDYIRYRLRRKV